MFLPQGFRYASVYAGIRKVATDDLILIASERPASAAAVFTTNRVKAAPVVLAQEHLAATGGKVSAVLANAGNANCATRTGRRVAQACCRAAGKLLRVPGNRVLPASTGVIGVELDPNLILKALPRLVKGLSPDRFEDAAHAILTTDTVPKMATADVALKHGSVRIAGFTKGSGMIHPRMATTLGFVMTDADIDPPALRGMLRIAVERSYHRLSVDGDTSTNDMVLLLAGGASGMRPTPSERKVFTEVLCQVLEDLAAQIARDGEGARKAIIIDVAGAPDDDAAATIARAIANSPLVKTAIAGSDPNWGRILSAAGNSGVAFEPRQADIRLQGVSVCKGGLAADFSEPDLKARLEGAECRILFTIRGEGRGQARFWTCDLTEKYIEINASYRT